MSQRVVTSSDTESLLRTAFYQVCDPKNIHAPIDCVVPFDSANIYHQAIELYHGRPPSGESKLLDGNDMYRLTSAGSVLNEPCPF